MFKNEERGCDNELTPSVSKRELIMSGPLDLDESIQRMASFVHNIDRSLRVSGFFMVNGNFFFIIYLSTDSLCWRLRGKLFYKFELGFNVGYV